MRSAVLLAAWVMGAIDLGLVLVVVGGRTLAVRNRRRTERLESQLRPLVLESLDGPVDLPATTRHLEPALRGLVRRYARLLSGAARLHLSEAAVGAGVVDRQLALLTDRRAWRRASALMVIGDVGSSSHAPLARPFLRDRDLDVRMAAARSIGCLGFAHASAELVSATAVGLLPRFLCAEVVQALGQGAAPGISLLLADPDPSVRAVAVEMLGLVGDASFTTALGTLVSEDPSDEVRARAARSLGRIGGSDASRLLAVALDDPTGYVRVAAIGALAATGGAEWIGSIARLARSDDFDVARSAARSLALLDKRRLSVESTMWPDAIHLAEAMDRLEFR